MGHFSKQITVLNYRRVFICSRSTMLPCKREKKGRKEKHDASFVRMLWFSLKMKPFGGKSQMAATLSVFSAPPGSSKTVYEHKQLSGREKSSLGSLTSPSDSKFTNKEISSIQCEKRTQRFQTPELGRITINYCQCSFTQVYTLLSYKVNLCFGKMQAKITMTLLFTWIKDKISVIKCTYFFFFKLQ